MHSSLDACDEIFARVRNTEVASELRATLAALFEIYPTISFEIGRGSVFWRGRKMDGAPFDRASEMGHPPKHLAIPGRLNDRGAPRLYASTRSETVLHELGAKPGDFIQLVGFRIKHGCTLRLAAVGELYHVYKTGYIKSLGIDPDNALSRMLNAEGIERGRQLIYIDAFLASLLGEANAHEGEYQKTRIIAEIALNKSSADGFFYPSVQDGLGMNVVLDPAAYDDKTHLVRSYVVRVLNVRQFGLIDYHITQEANDMSSDGVFSWREPEGQNIARFFGLTEKEHAMLRDRAAPADGNAFLDLIKHRQ